jgi:hypothetical protein
VRGRCCLSWTASFITETVWLKLLQVEVMCHVLYVLDCRAVGSPQGRTRETIRGVRENIVIFPENV